MLADVRELHSHLGLKRFNFEVYGDDLGRCRVYEVDILAPSSFQDETSRVTTFKHPIPHGLLVFVVEP